MSFRLWTIFYVFALFAAAMATFGPGGGIIAAAVVLGFWAWFFYGAKLRFGLAELVVLIFIAGVLLALLLPSVQSAQEASTRNTCQNQLKQLAFGIENYVQANGTFPPAFVADADSKPILSWRVLILPFIEEQDLYDRIDRSQAWDHSTNRRFSSMPLSVLQCPSHFHQAVANDYFACVGPRAIWTGSTGRRAHEITDGAENTILLIESHQRPGSWAKPNDLSMQEAIELLTNPPEAGDGHRIGHGFFYLPSYGRNVLFADGRVQFIAAPLSRELAEALLTMDGGEAIDARALGEATEPKLDYAKCYAFGMFVFLSLLPAVRLRRHDLERV